MLAVRFPVHARLRTSCGLDRALVRCVAEHSPQHVVHGTPGPGAHRARPILWAGRPSHPQRPVSSLPPASRGAHPVARLFRLGRLVARRMWPSDVALRCGRHMWPDLQVGIQVPGPSGGPFRVGRARPVARPFRMEFDLWPRLQAAWAWYPARRHPRPTLQAARATQPDLQVGIQVPGPGGPPFERGTPGGRPLEGETCFLLAVGASLRRRKFPGCPRDDGGSRRRPQPLASTTSAYTAAVFSAACSQVNRVSARRRALAPQRRSRARSASASFSPHAMSAGSLPLTCRPD